VHSVENEGSTFEIVLPLAPGHELLETPEPSLAAN
jgi:hypothetical protein